jgi:hypothetical protein
LLGAIKGAGAVRDRGRLGIHHVFEVPCVEDLREDVGALAASKKWALRELSWRKPTLEQLFARIALDLPLETPEDGAGAPAAAPSGNVTLQVDAQLRAAPASVPVAAPSSFRPLNPFEAAAPSASAPAPSDKPADKPAAPRVVYNLNPFDQGASRDLSRPKAIDDAPRAE